jgi:arylsulfatase
MPNGDVPSILNSSCTFKAEVEIPNGRAEGMIVTVGGRVATGSTRWKASLYNFVDMKRTRWEGPDAPSQGRHVLEFDFKYDGLGMGTLAFNNVSGRGGTGVLNVDGKEVARQRMEPSIPLIVQRDENFDIVADMPRPPGRLSWRKVLKFSVHSTHGRFGVARGDVSHARKVDSGR